LKIENLENRSKSHSSIIASDKPLSGSRPLQFRRSCESLIEEVLSGEGLSELAKDPKFVQATVHAMADAISLSIEDMDRAALVLKARTPDLSPNHTEKRRSEDNIKLEKQNLKTIVRRGSGVENNEDSSIKELAAKDQQLMNFYSLEDDEDEHTCLVNSFNK